MENVPNVLNGEKSKLQKILLPFPPTTCLCVQVLLKLSWHNYFQILKIFLFAYRLFLSPYVTLLLLAYLLHKLH